MFENILGNNSIKNLLSNSIKTDKVSHSYMFVGISGIGKKIIAKDFAKGIVLKDHVCCPTIIEVENKNTALITITEGKYHQIKRMFGCFGAKVVELHRIRMGNLDLPTDLKQGECRELSAKEINLLKEKIAEL